jgi:hypothetical protein
MILLHIKTNDSLSLSLVNKTQILCNDADAHRKQCKSLPTERKIKILETNADAHEKKQESLSPEDKDLFVKNNTDAQNKHCKSLAPNQKAQVLEKMLPNKKNIESVSLLNKKLK